MELRDKYSLLRKMFDAGDGEHLGDVIQRVLDSPNREAYFDKYVDAFPDLSRDELRPVWQLAYADRENKKQDFTPEPLADLCAHILTMANGESLYDCCSGSGALSIAVWNIRKDIRVICQELDETLLPLLLFNLCVRGICGIVQHANVLTGEVFQSYEIVKGERYSCVTCQMFPGEIHADLAISNPPYNLRAGGELQNYTFVRRCIETANRAVLLLPNGVLSGASETKWRKWLCEEELIQSVVMLPDSVFESTSIPVCALVLDRRKRDCVYLVDARTLGEEYTREMRGTGGASHEARVYKKTMTGFSDQQIAAIQEMTEREVGLSIRVTYERVKDEDWSFIQGKYTVQDVDAEHTVHRSYSDIIADINKVGRMRNTIKVTVNLAWGKQLGLDGLMDACVGNKESVQRINEQLRQVGIEDSIIEPDYLLVSRAKEFSIVQKDKEILSPVLTSFIPLWFQHIRTMNEFENLLLAELRDALLEPLMTGRIGFVNDVTKSE